MAVYFGYIYIILFYIFTAKHKKVLCFYKMYQTKSITLLALHYLTCLNSFPLCNKKGIYLAATSIDIKASIGSWKTAFREAAALGYHSQQCLPATCVKAY